MTRADRLLSSAILAARARGEVAVVADIKPVSPRDGDLLAGREPAAVARALEAAGAAALSVVTEAKHFGGSVQALRAVAEATTLPVLAKDFFASPEQIAEAREAGASAVLIILAMVCDPMAAKLYRKARELGMEAVVEVHTCEELDRALPLQPTLIGINNRDILALETDPGDVRITERLAPLVPEGVLTVSESSLRSADDVRRAVQAGADAVLIGTALLQAADLREALASFQVHAR